MGEMQFLSFSAGLLRPKCRFVRQRPTSQLPKVGSDAPPPKPSPLEDRAMRLNNTHPDLIVAQAMVPSAASVSEVFRSLSLRLATRIAPANDRVAKKAA